MSKINLQDVKTKMCLFHFLDGYLNDDISVGDKDKVRTEILNCGIDNKILTYFIETIITHDDEIIDKQYTGNKSDRHVTKDGITNKQILLNNFIDKTAIKYDLDKPENKTNDAAFTFINTNMRGKYFISNIINDNHATSLVLFIDSSDNINILSFKSMLVSIKHILACVLCDINLFSVSININERSYSKPRFDIFHDFGDIPLHDFIGYIHISLTVISSII
jgi:hypothetical protein